MKKIIIFFTLLFLFSCFNKNIENKNLETKIETKTWVLSQSRIITNSWITEEKKEKELQYFWNIKTENTWNGIQLTWEIKKDWVNKVEVVWKNNWKEDPYFLKKFNPEEKKWITNLKYEFWNLWAWENIYIIKLYKDDEVLEEKEYKLEWKECIVTYKDKETWKNRNLSFWFQNLCDYKLNDLWFDWYELKLNTDDWEFVWVLNSNPAHMRWGLCEYKDSKVKKFFTDLSVPLNYSDMKLEKNGNNWFVWMIFAWGWNWLYGWELEEDNLKLEKFSKENNLKNYNCLSFSLENPYIDINYKYFIKWDSESKRIFEKYLQNIKFVTETENNQNISKNNSKIFWAYKVIKEKSYFYDSWKNEPRKSYIMKWDIFYTKDKKIEWNKIFWVYTSDKWVETKWYLLLDTLEPFKEGNLSTYEDFSEAIWKKVDSSNWIEIEQMCSWNFESNIHWCLINSIKNDILVWKVWLTQKNWEERFDWVETYETNLKNWNTKKIWSYNL